MMRFAFSMPLFTPKRDDEIRQSHENEHEDDALSAGSNETREIVAAVGKHLQEQSRYNRTGIS